MKAEEEGRIQKPEGRRQEPEEDMTLAEALVIVGRVAMGIEEMGREMERCAERLRAQSIGAGGGTDV
jgi:hypothetical protein